MQSKGTPTTIELKCVTEETVDYDDVSSKRSPGARMV